MRGSTVAQLSELRSSEGKLARAIISARAIEVNRPYLAISLRGRAAALAGLLFYIDIVVAQSQTIELCPARSAGGVHRDLTFMHLDLLAQNDQPPETEPPLPPSQFNPDPGARYAPMESWERVRKYDTAWLCEEARREEAARLSERTGERFRELLLKQARGRRSR